MKEITLELNIYGVRLEISGNYYPEEPSVMYDGNLEGYPGAYAEFEIESVKAGDVDIYDLLSEQAIEAIKDAVIENQQS